MSTEIEAIWQNLLAGNRRYVTEKMSNPRQSARRRGQLKVSQQPMATILSCSDSRVPSEIIFDQGLGDLFVVRVAGNIVADAVLGSLEYSIEYLQVRLIVVVGHQSCGAVGAAVTGGQVGGHIGSLTRAIAPAIDRVKDQPGDPIDNAVRSNVSLVVEQLKASQPILAAAINQDTIKIIGAYYNLDSGDVEAIA